MTLVKAERIKLFSTRSPYWCLIAVLIAALLFAVFTATANGGIAAVPYTVLRGANLGLSIFMVLAALSITTEYRFGTIKSTFLAAPKRGSVLLAKSLLVAVVGLVAGIVVALAAFYLAKFLTQSPEQMQLSSADDLRQVLGYGPLFAIAGVIAVAVGSMIRQSAGAVTIVLLWPLLIENLVGLIPGFGEDYSPWLPFKAADSWVSLPSASGAVSAGPTPVQGLLVFAAWALVLWVIALVLLKKRDA